MILLATQVRRNTTGPKGQLQSVSTSTTARVAVEECSLPEGGEKGPRGGGKAADKTINFAISIPNSSIRTILCNYLLFTLTTYDRRAL